VAIWRGGVAKLTKRTVDALKPRAKPYVAFDDDVKGFGLRVMPSGVKTFVLEYRPGAGGRGVAKRRLTIGRHGNLTAVQARDAALTALASIRLGDDPMANRAASRAAPTVSAIIDAFLRDHAFRLKPMTRSRYEASLAKVRAAYGNLKAASLTRGHVSSLHQSMSQTPYAANRVLATVSSCWAWAISRGILSEATNPAARCERFREEGRERFLSSEELSRLGDAIRECEPHLGPHAAAAIRLLAVTGMRLGEVLSLRWREIDFERGVIFLPDSKTGRKTVYLGAPSLAILATLPRLEGSPFVIPGRGAAKHRADLKRPWAAVTKAAKLEGLRIHDLRHSFASIGAGASLGLPIIGKLLGHSQAATTHRYAHLDADPMRRAAETIGATIAAAMGGPAWNVVPMVKSR
jgi:integrase